MKGLQKQLEQREKSELIAMIQQMLRQEPEVQWLLTTPLPTSSQPKISLDPEVYRQQVLAAKAPLSPLLAASTYAQSLKAGSSSSIQASDCERFLAGHPHTQENSRHAYMTRRNWMPKEINSWAMYSRKTSPSPLPEPLKMEVTTRANELIETVLKPKYIQPPPENPQFNYVVNIYGKWYHKAFYFCAEYRVAGPHAIEPGFEAKFARMQYAGNRRFHLSFMRYTNQWVQLYTDLTVDECIETVRDDSYFSL